MQASLSIPWSLSTAIVAGAREAGSAAFVFAIVTATAAEEGGYFPPSWGWSAVGCLLVVFGLLMLGAEVSLGKLDRIFIASLLLLLVWTACSAAWSQSVGRTVQDAQRTAIYVSAALAVLALARRSGGAIAVGLAAAATFVCAYALATRLLPDLMGYDGGGIYRLARPLGYWNGLAMVAAVGVIVSAGLAVGASQRIVRTGAAAALPVLFVTLYFTFSRGGWLALVLGLALSFALDPRRLAAARSLAVLAPVSVAAVAIAARAPALVQASEPYARAVREGHGLALALPLLAAASGLIAFTASERQEPPLERAQRVRVGLLVAVAVTAAALLASQGGAGGAVQAQSPPPARDQAGSLQSRLFSASTNSRLDYWRVAVKQYAEHPLLGSGAGTFELYWNRDRPAPIGSRFAHNLYLQALAELGPVALILLAVGLAAPFAALRSARRLPVVPAVAGAYAAVLAHAALDWDWQLPAVTVIGLCAGSAVLVAARAAAPPRPLSQRLRIALLCLVAALAAVAATGWHGNRSLALASAAVGRGDYREAVERAEAARRWQPWASEPWVERGLAEIGLGEIGAARASFVHAVEKDPADWQTWYDLALVSHGAQRASALRHARLLNPLSREVRLLAGAAG